LLTPQNIHITFEHWQSRAVPPDETMDVTVIEASVINSWNSETAVQLLCIYREEIDRARPGELLGRVQATVVGVTRSHGVASFN